MSLTWSSCWAHSYLQVALEEKLARLEGEFDAAARVLNLPSAPEAWEERLSALVAFAQNADSALDKQAARLSEQRDQLQRRLDELVIELRGRQPYTGHVPGAEPGDDLTPSAVKARRLPVSIR